MIIDFHTHCFADNIAARAMGSLIERSLYPAHFDGTLNGLKKSMRSAGIDLSIVCNIATNPHQTEKVNDWAISSNGDGIISFGSVHPEYKNFSAEIARLKNAGIKGVKFHPDYQGFDVDDKSVYPLYETLAENEMVMLFHCGHDLVPRERYRCLPKAFVKFVNDFKGAKIVGAHLGGQDLWDDVFEYVAPCDVYVDTSFGFKYLSQNDIDRFIGFHGEDKILFGTDTPWQCQKTEVREMRSFVSGETAEKIFHANAEKLLGLQGEESWVFNRRRQRKK